MSMRSLSLHTCVTQLLNDRIDETGAMLFGWMARRRVEGKEVVALQIGGATADRRQFAVRGFNPCRGVFETCPSLVYGVCVARG